MFRVHYSPSVQCVLLVQLLGITSICEATDWTAGSVLGLQRGFQITKGGVLPRPTEADLRSRRDLDRNTGSLLGLQREALLQQRSVKLQEEDDIEAASYLHVEALQRRGSMLGSQHGFQTQRVSVDGEDKADDWAAGSLLGLQRGIRIEKAAKASIEDEDEEWTAGSVLGLQRSIRINKNAKVLVDDEDDAKLDLMSGSLLGLQRGFRIHKKAEVTQDPIEGEVPLASQQSRIPPEEQSLDWTAGSVLGLQRRFKIHKKGAEPQEAAKAVASRRSRLVRSEPKGIVSTLR